MSRGHTARDAARLALGTLTVLPTRPPAVVDRRVASWAMTLAPVVAGVLGLLGAALLWLLGWAGAGLPEVPWASSTDPGGGWSLGPTLAATLTIALLAVLTRGMHLDGLADTADGLGSGRPGDRALEVMRRGDVGPFGVVTLVLVLLVQVHALSDLLAAGNGAACLVVALVVSRVSLPLLCSEGVPAARTEGLGHLVAGSVSRLQLALAAVLAVLLGSAALGMTALGVDVAADRGVAGLAVPCGVASAAGLAAGAALARRAVRRLGGITGDVLGAGVETTFTVALVVLAALL